VRERKHPLLRKKIKYEYGTVHRVEQIAYDRDGRPIVMMRVQKKKPYSVWHETQKLRRRNPDRVDFAEVGRWPVSTRVFTYKNSKYCFIASGTSYITIEPERLKAVHDGIEAAIRYFYTLEVKKRAEKVK